MRRTIRLAFFVMSFLALALAPAAALAQSAESLEGFAEWVTAASVVVDGEAVTVDGSTLFAGLPGMASLEPGSRLEVRAVRTADGQVIARLLRARPNGVDLFEADVVAAANSQESRWLRSGRIQVSGGAPATLATSGPQVEQLRRILLRIAPPHLDARALRVYAVESREWNAMAMPNGSIWVFRGLLDAMDQDELAIILGHELAHVTYEHSRRSFKRALLGQAAQVGVRLVVDRIKSAKARAVSAVGGNLAASVWVNRYSRQQEDQADRVGLRYAFQGGFDVWKAPRLWERFARRYGNGDAVSNFLFDTHSRPEARIGNLERLLALSYHPTSAVLVASGAPGLPRPFPTAPSWSLRENPMRPAAVEPRRNLPVQRSRALPAEPAGVAAAAPIGVPAALRTTARPAAASRIVAGMSFDQVRGILGPCRHRLETPAVIRWAYPTSVVSFVGGRVVQVTSE
jgi:Zn-dependent protease with chaperone function